MERINVESAATTELVAFYNAHCHDFGKKQVKKFQDRQTAQLRVTQLLGDMDAEEKTEALPPNGADVAPVSDAPKHDNITVFKAFAQVDGELVCPSCGSAEVFTGRGGEDGVVIDEDTFRGCHECNWSHDDKDDIVEEEKRPGNNSEGVAASWTDPDVRAARLARYPVLVDGVEYSGVERAFKQLGLNTKQAGRLRAKLRDSGPQTYEGRKFELKAA